MCKQVELPVSEQTGSKLVEGETKVAKDSIRNSLGGRHTLSHYLSIAGGFEMHKLLHPSIYFKPYDKQGIRGVDFSSALCFCNSSDLNLRPSNALVIQVLQISL